MTNEDWVRQALDGNASISRADALAALSDLIAERDRLDDELGTAQFVANEAAHRNAKLAGERDRLAAELEECRRDRNA